MKCVSLYIYYNVTMNRYIHTLAILLSLLIFSSVTMQAKEKRTEGEAQSVEVIDARWLKANYAKAEYMIPMRDGVKLYTAVFAPKDKRTKHPVLFTRTPYGSHPYGKKQFDLCLKPIYENYLRAGYILVFQDVRGRFLSEGEFVNVRPMSEGGVDESTDAYDSVEWLLRKIKHHNGRVGFYGCSYDGFYTLMAGASAHPSIKAISPQAPIFDWFAGDDFHHNGAFALMDAVSFLPNFGEAGREKPSPDAAVFEPLVQGKQLDFFMKNRITDITTKLSGRIPFWDEMMDHPDYDAWWQSRSSRKAVEKIARTDVPILLVGGMYDAEDSYGTWATYHAMRAVNPDADCRFVVGPWAHGAWRGNDAANSLGDVVFSEDSLSTFYRDEVEFPFFEKFLREEGDGGLSEAGGLIFFGGENCWREMSEWPAVSQEQKILYFTEEGTLADEASDYSSSYSSYISDPQNPVPYYHDVDNKRASAYMVSSQAFLQGREDLLEFVSAPLEEDVTVAGVIKAHLFASISTSDADFVVKVIDVGPEGEYEMLVRGDILRGRYRNSLSEPKPFTPNQIEEISLSLVDVAHTFMAGHRIKVQVQSSWFPLFDMSPQQFVDPYKAKASDFIPSQVKIYHDKEHSSRIELPLMK